MRLSISIRNRAGERREKRRHRERILRYWKDKVATVERQLANVKVNERESNTNSGVIVE